jgi:hypothetical protein
MSGRRRVEGDVALGDLPVKRGCKRACYGWVGNETSSW